MRLVTGLEERFGIRFRFQGPMPNRAYIQKRIRDYNNMADPAYGPAQLIVLHPDLANADLSVPDGIEVAFDPLMPRQCVSVGRWAR